MKMFPIKVNRHKCFCAKKLHHWVDIKIAVLTYKCLQVYITLFAIIWWRYVIRSRHPKHLAVIGPVARGDLIPPAWNTVTYGPQGFHYAAEAVWNRLIAR